MKILWSFFPFPFPVVPAGSPGTGKSILLIYKENTFPFPVVPGKWAGTATCCFCRCFRGVPGSRAFLCITYIYGGGLKTHPPLEDRSTTSETGGTHATRDLEFCRTALCAVQKKITPQTGWNSDRVDCLANALCGLWGIVRGDDPKENSKVHEPKMPQACGESTKSQTARPLGQTSPIGRAVGREPGSNINENRKAGGDGVLGGSPPPP